MAQILNIKDIAKLIIKRIPEKYRYYFTDKDILLLTKIYMNNLNLVNKVDIPFHINTSLFSVSTTKQFNKANSKKAMKKYNMRLSYIKQKIKKGEDYRYCNLPPFIY